MYCQKHLQHGGKEEYPKAHTLAYPVSPPKTIT